MDLNGRFSMAIGYAFIGAVMLGVSGCAIDESNTDRMANAVPVTTAAMPTTVRTYPRIEQMLACIKETGVLRGRTFEVGTFADSTGKINSVAAGSTGSFLPQGGSSSYVTDALSKAGARVVSTYFGRPRKPVYMDYSINGIFNSLDFGKPFSADVRVAGIGPTAGYGWAQLSLSIQLDESATRVNRQMSMIQRPVRYKHLGVGVGREYSGTLVTGNIAIQNQERLQLEALNGPIALGVADVVMKEFPRAAERCRGIIADLLDTQS